MTNEEKELDEPNLDKYLLELASVGVRTRLQACETDLELVKKLSYPARIAAEEAIQEDMALHSNLQRQIVKRFRELTTERLKNNDE